MGLVSPERHDAFISYSHDENEFFGGYVGRFRDELFRRIRPAVRRLGASVDDREPAIFIDEHGMPASGELDSTLKENVERAELLFVFVGKLYLQSAYCGKELDWFRNRFKGSVKAALERTFVIVLEPGALKDARAKFRSNDVEGIVQPFYDRTSQRPIGLNQPDEGRRFEDLFMKVVDGAATQLAALMQATTACPPPPLHRDESGDKIMLGIVPPRLETVRRELDRLLREGGAGVHLVDRDDLKNAPERLRELAREARFLVQPFDLGEVEYERRDPPGGHLGRQAALLEGTGIALRWWMVPEPAGRGEQHDPAETEPEHVAFLAAKAGAAERLPVETLAQRLLDDLQPKNRLCHVLIEYTQTDAESRTLLECFLGELKRRWERTGRGACSLDITRADWSELLGDQGWHYIYHGFIMVDRSKPLTAIGGQVNSITSRVVGAPHRLVCRIFTLPPKLVPTLEPDDAIWSAPIVFGQGNGGGLVLDAEGEARLDRFFDGVSAAATGDGRQPEDRPGPVYGRV